MAFVVRPTISGYAQGRRRPSTAAGDYRRVRYGGTLRIPGIQTLHRRGGVAPGHLRQGIQPGAHDVDQAVLWLDAVSVRIRHGAPAEAHSEDQAAPSGVP